MSERKQQISKKLVESGAAWAVTDRKCILPGDGFGAKPSYHIHPDASHPHENQIRHFSSLDEIEAYASAKLEAKKAWDDFKSGKISFEESERRGWQAMEDHI
jgi:hypothetical protein